MPLRSVLTEAQRADLLALPEDEAALVRHWTLSAEGLRIIVGRRRPHNRLGFAIQLCGLRYPGRLLWPGEVIRHAPLAFVGEQLGIAPEALADYAARGPTRYEQLDTLRDVFDFQTFSRPVRMELQAWLLPPALTTTNGAVLARLLLDELRRRRIIVPGISPVERMVGKALLAAYSKQVVSDYDSMSSEQRQARGWTGKFRASNATFVGTVSMPALFDHLD